MVLTKEEEAELVRLKSGQNKEIFNISIQNTLESLGLITVIHTSEDNSLSSITPKGKVYLQNNID